MNDITLRALDVLKEVTVIAAEDTRHTRQLLSRHGIATPMFALHEHNEEQAAPGLVEKLLDGQSVALVSDAGTPFSTSSARRVIPFHARCPGRCGAACYCGQEQYSEENNCRFKPKTG